MRMRDAPGGAQVVLVNSSWTRGHIDALWAVPGAQPESSKAIHQNWCIIWRIGRTFALMLGIRPDRTCTVYPPCDTAAALFATIVAWI